MKNFIKKKYSYFFVLVILIFPLDAYSKNTNIKYTNGNISNYFLGIISANQNYANEAYKYLNKVKSLKNIHPNYNTQFIRTLVLLDKFEQAFSFSKDLEKEDKLFFEADLLLGLEYFINKDYKNAKKHFQRLSVNENYYGFFQGFFDNFLLSAVEAAENNQKESFKFLNKTPKRYQNLKLIQDSFLQCYFNTPKTIESFKKLTSDENFNFSRYNFFLANYLLHKNKKLEAKKIIKEGREKHDSNLLIKQSENFILNGKINKVKNFFNCENLEDSIAEIFYIIANLHSTEKNYQLSNFYLKISYFFNNKFTPNKTLLAENFFYQKKFQSSKKIYNIIKKVGPVYSWHASKRLAVILSNTEGDDKAVLKLKNEFDLLKNPNFEQYYELANFHKDRKYFKESIKYYTLVLENIEKNHYLIAKVLDRRGTSYERVGDWKKAEKDLKDSLKLEPDQAHVLNYLAYSWIEKRIHQEKALTMLEKAVKLKENDGYIIDSLGWAHYLNKNYTDAEKFLQIAVELKPMDPVICSHYADTLWMVKKNIQARYIWQHVLSLKNVSDELRSDINKKLILGITKKL